MRVTSGTIARTIVLGLALLNSVLGAFGFEIINIPDETINTVVDAVFLIVAAIAAWWKNNSFTEAALEADEVMRELKNIQKD